MRRFILTFAVLLCSLSLVAQTDTLRVMTYNLRFGELGSMRQLSDYIASRNPDLVALQECDWATSRLRAPLQAGVKFINELAYHTGMFGAYGKAIDYCGGYYGVGVLSRYPMTTIQRVLLPHEASTEQRVMLVTEVDVAVGSVVVFASTHLEVSSSELRVKQAAFINDYFKECDKPVILAGDMNAEPDSPEIKLLADNGWTNMTDENKTFSSTAPSIKIDYIFCKGTPVAEPLATQVCTDTALSDHFPVISELIVTYKNNNNKKHN